MNEFAILLFGVLLGISIYRRPKDERVSTAVFYAVCLSIGFFIGMVTR